MRKFSFPLFSLITVLAMGQAPVHAEWGERAERGGTSVGMSITDSFYFTVGSYYGLPERNVRVARERGIPDEELSVAFFLASRRQMDPMTVISMRLGGMSWMDVTRRLGFGADVFYVPVEGVKGPPYGKAYGYYKNKPQKDWKSIKLSDADVVNFVNLRFLSEYYGLSAGVVMGLRGDGKGFVAINDEIRKGKKGDKGDKAGPGGKDKGRGKFDNRPPKP
ncbi:MAG: hypothetical protein V3W31_07845 [Thermodesulfobacteriota bacterium]